MGAKPPAGKLPKLFLQARARTKMLWRDGSRDGTVVGQVGGWVRLGRIPAEEEGESG
jgi:hypothetical protein